VLTHLSSPQELAERAERLFNHIEAHVARRAANSHHGLHHFISEHSAHHHRQAIKSKQAGERSTVSVSIQQMERFAHEWAYLVPHDPGIRAGMAHRAGQEFAFTHARVPHLRQVLGLDDEAVKEAYFRIYGRPLEQIYATKVSPTHHFHWLWSYLSARLESLPPFWTAYALTLTETVGATILALPIAVAGIGPIPGIVLLVLLGIVNMLTIGFMSEAVARSGSIRYGTGFIGQTVADYLGVPGSLLLTSSLFGLCVLVLLAYYVGFSRALEGASGIPAPFWAAALFLVGLYYLRRESLNATIASALVVGAINIAIILAISALAFTRLQTANLTQMNLPLVGGRPLDPSLLGLIFGVILTAYFGHLSVSNCGRVVLRRDPSGRSLIWGNIAAQATAILLYSIFVLAVAGAVPASQLTGLTGTSLEPLAVQSGWGIRLLGFVFVVLGIGMASIHFSLGLFNLVRERLPAVRNSRSESLEPAVQPHRSSTEEGRLVRLKDVLLTGRGRFLTEISPIVILFLIAEWALFTRSLAFTSILSFIGVIVASLLAGIFPVLLIAASRRKGDYAPGTVYRIMGNPVLLISLYLLFLASLLLHGLVIWQDPVERGIALLTALAIVSLTLHMIRRGLLAPRVVVELREQKDALTPAVLVVTAGGKASSGQVCLGRPEGEQLWEVVGGQLVIPPSLKSISMKLPPLKHADLKVWTHRVTQEGDSEPLPAWGTVRCGDLRQPFQFRLANGVALLGLKGQDCNLSIDLEGEPK
jgi:amino acid permease